jgi:phytanoyl-CoA hydroxylase
MEGTMTTRPIITDDQLDQYWKLGYVVLPRFFAEDELEPLRKRSRDIVEERVPPAKDMLVMKDVMVAKGAVKPGSRAEAIAKVQDFHNDEVLYGRYVKHPRLLDLVERFCGPDIKVVHNMLMNKPPHVDGRHPLHQDLLYFLFRPADRIVAVVSRQVVEIPDAIVPECGLCDRGQ